MTTVAVVVVIITGPFPVIITILIVRIITVINNKNYADKETNKEWWE